MVDIQVESQGLNYNKNSTTLNADARHHEDASVASLDDTDCPICTAEGEFTRVSHRRCRPHTGEITVRTVHNTTSSTAFAHAVTGDETRA